MSIQKPTRGHLLAVLFIIVKTWKQPRCPSVGDWTNKLWYIQTMEYYNKEQTADTHNNLDEPQGNCAERKSQSQQHTYSRIPFM